MQNEYNKEFIKVCCAIIEKNGKILACQRSENMSLPLKWEFPGGKVKQDEDEKQCIKREINEELGIEINILFKLYDHFHEYNNKKFILIPFVCSISSGTVNCTEHKSIIWDKAKNLENLDWAKANINIYYEYIRHIEEIC